MWNPNDLLKKAVEQTYKRGYKLEEKIEFIIVRNTLLKLVLPTSNFDNNLETLQIINKSDGIGYNAKNNNISGITNGNELIHELFHMSSNINNETSDHGSLISNSIGYSLNEGLTEYLTSKAINKYEVKYPIEKYISEILINIYGIELLNKHIEGNPNELYNYFNNDKNTIIEIINNLDKFTKSIIESRDFMYLGKFNDIPNLYNKAYE